MIAVGQVIRHTPARGVWEYFQRRGLIQDGTAACSGVARSSYALLKVVERLAEHDQAMMNGDFERIWEMSDEAGQWAILHVMTDRARLEELANPHERALWLFVNDPAAFRRAEEIRWADTRRQGRLWSGFVGPPNLEASRDEGDHRRFEEGVRAIFASRNAHLDLFERLRAVRDEQVSRVVQAVVYRDGLPDAQLVFNADGELELRPHRPVYEVSIIYEPDTGVIEVVAQGMEHRARLARLFAGVILQQGIIGLRIPLRQYDLSRLLTPCDFPSDPGDGIDAVKVTWLRLRHRSFEHGHIALIANWRDSLTVHEQARQWIVAADELPDTFEADEATLSIRLRPARGSTGRRRTINVTITLPNGCNLKSKTEKERLICDKYLPRWGLVKEV